VDDFPIYTKEDRLTYVAYFYDRLTRHLLHLPLLSPADWEKRKRLDHFDLKHEGLRTYIEAKGSSNANVLKYFEDQLDEQIGELGFPIDDGMALIFSYTNREPRQYDEAGKIKRGTLLGKMKSWSELSRFLSGHTTKLYAIDIRLLSDFRKKHGTRAHTRDKFRDRRILNVNKKMFTAFAANAATSLAELGYPPAEIRRWLPPNTTCIPPRSVRANLDGRDISFGLVPLLSNGLKTRFLKQLNGTVEKVLTNQLRFLY